MVRQDLLVCPIMELQETGAGIRDIYLPQSDKWYAFNLRTLQGGYLGGPLLKELDGGSIIQWDASIYNAPHHVPYITPMFVRYGTFLPTFSSQFTISDMKLGQVPSFHKYNFASSFQNPRTSSLQIQSHYIYIRAKLM
jgi:alpha-glucosidase (family GH31 glycosyl hydrolase)